MDQQLLNLIRQLDRQTHLTLEEYNDELEEILRRHSRGKSLVDTPKLDRDVRRTALRWAAAFGATLVAYNVIAARRSTKKDNERINRVLRYHGANRNATAFVNQQSEKIAQNIGVTFLDRRFPGTTIPVRHRIKTAAEGSERTIRAIIRDGMNEGKGSFDIAKDIQQYVIPDPSGKRVAPWTIIRRAEGLPVSYRPKGVPAGSVEYNAMRIARTETAYTYQQAPYLAHKDKWYYKGTLWSLSRSHPEVDECDELAAHDEGLGIGVFKVPPRIPHPHCLCNTQVVTVDTDEMIEMLKMLDWSHIPELVES